MEPTAAALLANALVNVCLPFCQAKASIARLIVCPAEIPHVNTLVEPISKWGSNGGTVKVEVYLGGGGGDLVGIRCMQM